MWICALFSFLACIILWYFQIKNNVKKKRQRKKTKALRMLEKYAEQSDFSTVYEKIIDLYEMSRTLEVEEIIQSSELPRYEKISVISSLNKILNTGIDEKTGLHKKTLILGQVIGYTISFCIIFFLLFIKKGDIAFINIIMIFSGSNVTVTFISYIVIESVILKKLPWSRQKNNTEEKTERRLFDKAFDVLDNIFGNY